MFNPQRVVTPRFNKLLALSLILPGSAFAVESATVVEPISHVQTAEPVQAPAPVVAVNAPVTPVSPVEAMAPVEAVTPVQVEPATLTAVELPPITERQAPASEGTVDWSSLQHITLNSTPKLCAQSVANVCFKSQIEKAYAANKFYPIWQDEALRHEFELQLNAVANTKMLPGLSARLSELDKLEAQKNDQAYDLLATDTYYVYRAFQQYIAKHRDVLFLSKPVQMSKSMQNFVLADDTFPMTLETLKDSRPGYVAFEATLDNIAKFKALPAHTLKASDFTRVYRYNDPLPKGKEVAKVLYTLGDMTKADYEKVIAASHVTNKGPVLLALQGFQKRHGLSNDGVVGPATIKQLVMPYAEISRRLALNTLRVATLNKHSEKNAHIWVNVPNYKLEMFDNGEVVFESKVIVGRHARPTNLFSSSINTMVVNPYWNVPITIKQQDVIPKIKRNIGYLKQKNMQVLNSWRDRTVIPASSIDWASVNPKTFPHEFQQGPGPQNSLGRVKFLMPNDYAIFLHDTPARGLFNKTKRDLSSGCVRVERAFDLANYVIDYQKRGNIPEFKSMLDSKKQKTVSLSKRIGVDFVYLTAWVDKSGTVQMREDIYGYDSPSSTKIKKQFITMKDFAQR